MPKRPGFVAADQIGHAVEAGHRHGGVDQRDLDLLAAAEPVAGDQRQQDRVAGRHARRHVDDRRSGSHRLSIRKAVQRHEAAFGLRDRIEARTQGELALAAIGRDRAIDQPRIGRRDRRIVEAEFLHHAAGEILHHHIRFRDQFARHLQRRRIGEIERNAALVAIETEKGRALAADFRMFIVAGVVASIRVFDLDHLGAEIGQRLRAGRAGNDPGEVDNQQTIEGSRFALCARRSLRQLRSGSHIRHFLLLFCLAKPAAVAATGDFKAFYRKPADNAKPRFCRAGPAADIALKRRQRPALRALAARARPKRRPERNDKGRPKKIAARSWSVRESSGDVDRHARAQSRSHRRCRRRPVLPTRRSSHRNRQALRESPSVWAGRHASAAPSRRN